MLPKVLALVSTVLMLMSLGFFVLGSTPLLILKHDVPMDSKVVRQVFHYCYRLVAVMAAAASLGFALQGRFALALFLVGIAGLALALRHWILKRMDQLRTTMHDGDTEAIRKFRRLHVTGIGLNLAQLVVIAVGLTRVTI
ncbi:hypothetical protein [Caenimonas sp. SL110]|uniref:hypothetical protein n=1 Tax=Caenimonas sp. SL110 TaxID=1450524 RepID=UPI0006544EC2|nr:hypothetical protein [Caenimonas sp. SL110]